MNKNRIHYYLIIILTLLSISGYAGTIKGTIRDKKGEAIPFASVFIPGTTMGTAANASGEYQLGLQPGEYRVICQSIGYKQISINVTITGNETSQHNFTLQDEGLSMKEVIVKSGKNEDPAYGIIRKAIKQRTFHLKQVKSFQTSIYLKGVLRTTEVPDKIFGQKIKKEDVGVDSTGKGVLYLLEEKADFYAQEPDKYRNIIHSVRESGNGQGLGFSQMPTVVTFYENNVRIMDQVAPRGLVSPVSDNAINFYKYKLEGEFVENNQIIYKIKVMHRREFEPVFDGFIYIVDGDWAIHSLNLTTTEKAGLEFVESLSIEQQFISLRPDTWVGQRQVFRPKLKLLGFGLTGNFVTVYTNQKVNEPVPDTIFNKRFASTYDKTATKKDTSYWSLERPIPLEDDEVKDYHVKDSIAAVPRDLVKEDSLRRRGNRIKIGNILYSGKTLNGKEYKQSFTINPLLYAINYNSVEGLNVAPTISYRRTLDTGNSINARIALRYGFENRHFNAMAGLSYIHNSRDWRTRGWTLGAEGGKYVFQYNPQNPVEPILNTVSTLLYNQNYLKLYERWDVAVYFRRSIGNGLRWNAKLNYQYRMPLDNETSYSWAKGTRSAMTDNVPDNLKMIYNGQHNALLAHIGISYSPVFKYVQYPDFKAPQGSDWPTFSVSYDKGISGLLDSKVNYDKWRVGIDGEQRMKLFGVLSYNIAAGGFLNDNTVSLPDMMHLFGNEYFLASPYLKSFQLAPYYKFSNTANIYGEAHVEYNLYGMLTNKIPLFRRLNWYFILGNNTFYAGDQKYYTEAFLSIDNIGYKIYRLLRVDLVHSWESNGINRTGIRIGLHTAGLLGTTKGKNGEW